ncbi:MAG: hypothetical protein IT236_13610 [Bacteroidia bacterium]|nr:hypothetical protein [Bacteroidia bacterium]
MNAGEMIGTLGVSLLLLAFALNLSKKLQVNSFTYLLLNVAGAALACVSSYLIRFWPFVILEGVWMISSLILLIKKPAHV